MNLGPAQLDLKYRQISCISISIWISSLNEKFNRLINRRLMMLLSHRQRTCIVMVYLIKYESLAKNGMLTDRQLEKVVIIGRKNDLNGCNVLLHY